MVEERENKQKYNILIERIKKGEQFFNENGAAEFEKYSAEFIKLIVEIDTIFTLLKEKGCFEGVDILDGFKDC